MSEGLQQLQAILDRELLGRPSLSILEAGCGSASWLNFGTRARMVGIDISEEQLKRNTTVREKVVGDIQQYEFPKESFDGIVCYNVLEHLPHPELAIEKFSHAIKPGGFIILGMPNVHSIKGLVTKYTPHILHVLAYRYIWGDKNAGKNDTVPFRTYLRHCISGPGIRKQAQKLGLESAYYATEDVSQFPGLQRKKIALVSYQVVKKFFQILSVGYIGDSELLILLKKSVQ
jgi:SAM-dependent methyltransferase